MAAAFSASRSDIFLFATVSSSLRSLPSRRSSTARTPLTIGTALTRTSSPMAAAPRSRLINPLLGMYFGIFSSLLAAIVLLLMMLEQLGVTDATLRTIMIAGFLGTFCAVGIATFTYMPAEYFASGRRVPAFFNGLVLAIITIGGTGLTALSGS